MAEPRPAGGEGSLATDETTGTMRRWAPWILAFGLALWALAPIARLTYLADDFALFQMIRMRIEQGDLSPATFFAERWSEAYTIYRPMTTLTLAIDDALFPYDPGGPHVTNLLLHLYTTGAIILLAAALLPRRHRLAAVGAGAIFAVYPLHTESLSWLAARGDVLATAFTLTGLITYLRARHAETGTRLRITLLVATGLLLAAALCSKESAIGVTMLPILVDVVTRRTPDRWLHWPLRYGPFLLLSVLFVLTRTAVIGDLVGSYGGVSPYHPDRLAEFARFLPTTVRDLLLHDSPRWTPLGSLRAARYVVWSAIAVLLLCGLTRRHSAFRPITLLALGWLAIVVGPFLPLYTVNLGLAGGRMFYGPAAAVALLGARLLAGASEAPVRRRVAIIAATLLFLAYGWTFRQVMGNYTRATETILSVHRQMTELRDATEQPTAFGLLDPPTIVDRAPVFGAFAQQSFSRFFRPNDPITVRTDRAAQPLPFLATKGIAIQLPLVVTRWDEETATLERLSARIPPPGPLAVWQTTDFSDWDFTSGRITSPELNLPTRSHFTIELGLVTDRPTEATLVLHTSENDFANPTPELPLRLTTGRQTIRRILGPPDLWPLAGNLARCELTWSSRAKVELIAIAFAPMVPPLEVLAREPLPGGASRVSIASPADVRQFRLTIVLRRRRFEQVLDRSVLPTRVDEAGRERVEILLPAVNDLQDPEDSLPDVPVLWFIDALDDRTGTVVARTPVSPR